MARVPRQESRMKRLHDYFFPHSRNEYRPNFFSARSLGVVAVGLLVLQGLYLAQTKLVFERTDFLAAVLPGVLTDLANEDRAQEGLSTLALDPKLVEAAQLAANDMAEKGYFSHNSPDGKTPWYWLDQVGYEYSHSGQNLAVNFTDSKDVEQAWLNSPTHRANIMKQEYTRIGIAVARGVYKGDTATFVVQYFATPPTVTVAAAPAVATPEAPPELVEDTEPTAASEVLSATDEQNTVVPNDSETPAQAVIEVIEEPLSAAAQAATSPHRTLLYVLSFLAALVTVLLAIAVATHLRKQYVEIMGGGLALLFLTLSFLTFHTFTAPGVTLPTDTGGSYVETAAL